MTHETIIAIYEMSQAIYNGNFSLQEGKRIMNQKHKINKNSFAIYYRAFKCMLDSKCCARGINTELRDYMLSRILKDYGIKKYEIAVNAYFMFITYDETHKHTNKIKERNLYQKHLRIILNYNKNGQ